MKKTIEKLIENYAGVLAFTFVSIGVIVIVLFLLITPFNDWSFDTNATLFAQYGDFIGGFIGTFFSLAGFLLVYKTLITQQDTLKQQDSDSKQDRFETIFFNLLKSQNEITTDIKAYFYNLKGDSVEISKTLLGRDFFIHSKKQLRDIWISLNYDYYLGFYNEQFANKAQEQIDDLYYPENYIHPDDANEGENKILTEIKLSQTNKIYNITIDKWTEAQTMDTKGKMSLTYGLFFQKYHYVAGHYFRHLYHLLDFTESNKLKQLSLTSDEKIKRDIIHDYNKYVSFIQSQMSSHELMLLFYNSLSFPKMQTLLITYNFLENLAVEDLIDSSVSTPA